MGEYTSFEVARMAGVQYRTLMYWVAFGLLNPVNARAGKRKSTIWNDKDVREASVLNCLRRAGFSLQRLRQAIDYLRSINHNPLSTGNFIVVCTQEGKPQDVIKICDTGEALQLLHNVGQLVLPLWQSGKE